MVINSSLINSVFEQSPLGMAFICCETGTILKVNTAYCSLLRRTENQLLGQTWMAFTHPDDIIKDFHAIRSACNIEKKTVQRLKRYNLPDGTIAHAHVSITPQETDQKKPVYLAIIQDLNWFQKVKQDLDHRTSELHLYRDEMINSLILVANFRDRECGGHLKRTSLYVQMILEATVCKHSFSNHGIKIIAKASMLHDIGKVGIPDAILLKPALLNPDEFSVMKTHTTLGVRALSETLRHIPHDSTFLHAKEMAAFHHERWDGTGYPQGLKESEIPFIARVMAIADVYDALRSKRPYKNALSHEESIHIIINGKGKYFDPELVEVFVSLQDEIGTISESVSDSSMPFDLSDETL